MCDNVVALGNVTADGSMIFGKNSDREPNEPHYVVIIPHATYPKGSMTRCIYIDILPVAETYAVLLGRSAWWWCADLSLDQYIQSIKSLSGGKK